jgi:peptidoglycan biosynthesis protein MviN/MurJ (putative lipid II flippase)
MRPPAAAIDGPASIGATPTASDLRHSKPHAEPRASLRIARVAALSAVSKGPGFLVPIVIAAGFGAGAITDTYFLAYAAVLFAGSSVGSALENTTVPDAAGSLRRGRDHAARRLEHLALRAFAWGCMSMVGTGLVLGAGLLISRPSGVSPSEVLLMYALMSPIPIAWCVSGTYSGALLGAGRLEASVASTGLRGVGALVGAIATPIAGAIWPLAIGLALGEVSRTVWLRHRWRRVLEELDAGAGVTKSALGPADGAVLRQVAAQMLVAGGPLCERLLIAAVGAAAISRVEYGSRLLWVASVGFDGGIAPYLLFRWSTQRAAGLLRVDWSMVFRPVVAAAALALVVGLSMAVFAPLIVRVVLDHGRFSPADALIVTRLLRLYAAGFVFSMIAICMERLLIARGESGRFLRLSAVRVGVRLTVVALALSPLSLLAAPCGYLVSEVIYALVVLLAILPMDPRRSRADR